jgi:hypothetical protein
MEAQLSGEMIDGFTVPIDADKPFTGFYRMKRAIRSCAGCLLVRGQKVAPPHRRG